jgi:hypothetical protein
MAWLRLSPRRLVAIGPEGIHRLFAVQPVAPGERQSFTSSRPSSAARRCRAPPLPAEAEKPPRSLIVTGPLLSKDNADESYALVTKGNPALGRA